MLLLHQRSIFFYSSPSSQSNRYLEVRFLLIYFDLFGVKSLQACVPHIRYILISPPSNFIRHRKLQISVLFSSMAPVNNNDEHPPKFKVKESSEVAIGAVLLPNSLPLTR
ncbi:hypothetical protein HanIR_Chr04g0186831 [Helianthus annuus]|nr:hypothetical protein HanIR_Chr04g0186831 [Helianthus annuus]